MYEILTRFAQSWGMYYAIFLFAIILVYALWPGNKSAFDRAARAPLDDENTDGA